MNHKTFFNFYVNIFLFGIILLCLVGISSTDVKAQSDDSSQISSAPQTVAPPTPILNPGGEKNPSCGYLNSRNSDPDFAHITSDAELKIDPPPPSGNSGPYNITGGGSVSIQDNDKKTFDFTSTKKITAVVVKGGNEGSNVYTYPPDGTNGDTRLRLPDLDNSISHLTFCYSLAPTSASAMLSGRIRDVNGKSISRTTVTLTKLSTGETLTTRTNLFGRYIFEDLATAQDYLITVNSRRYEFTPNSKVVNLNQDLTSTDFTAYPTGALIQSYP